MNVLKKPKRTYIKGGVDKADAIAPRRLRRANRNSDPLIAGLAQAFRPRRELTMTAYAERRIKLAPERAANPGPYRVGDASYQRGMQDAVTDPDVQKISFLTSSQVGKSQILTNVMSYYADMEPSPQLAVFPTQIGADEFEREQFSPTVTANEHLKAIFSRGYEYPGGYIAFVGSTIPAQLAGRPIRIVLADEVDRFVISSGKEGSPLLLAWRRTNTFRNRKMLQASTPTNLKTSVITAEFKQSKQHFFHVPCHECGHPQVLKWKNVQFDPHRPKKAIYVCEANGCIWTDLQKRRNVRDAELNGGGWGQPTNPGFYDDYFKCLKPTGTPEARHWGFYVNVLYSPWVSLAELVQEWINAEGDPAKEQNFRNTNEGLPWEGEVSSVADADQLKRRREEYSPRIVPATAGLVSAAVDVQDDRLEVLTQAWGVGDESWVLERIVIHSDPSVNATWDRLTETLLRRYPHAAGNRTLGIEAVAIDSGGHYTQNVYRYCDKHQKLGRRWYAIKGVPGEGKPIWLLSQQKLKKGTKLFLVGVDDAKTTLYARYAIQRVGQGYIHLHNGVSDDLIAQMTAEHAVTEYNGEGFPERKWQKPPQTRNEMLDLMVYNIAVRSSINIDMIVRLQRLHQTADKAVTAEEVGALFK
jgi:phage terminase large subunit GpA-like protein